MMVTTDRERLLAMHKAIAEARKWYEQIDDEDIQEEFLILGETLTDMDIELAMIFED